MRDRPLRFTLVSDGSSDRALLPMIRWLLRRAGVDVEIEDEWADLGRLRNPPKTLADKIKRFLELYPCDLLFVHRDAEGEAVDKRLDEIRIGIPVGQRCVPVIPVRMLEAWLLFDEGLIRKASGNPHGKAVLALPVFDKLESLPDPKTALFSLLKTASGLSGRRLARFNVFEARSRVAVLADDFTALLRLEAFRQLADSIAAQMESANSITR